MTEVALQQLTIFATYKRFTYDLHIYHTKITIQHK